MLSVSFLAFGYFFPICVENKGACGALCVKNGLKNPRN